MKKKDLYKVILIILFSLFIDAILIYKTTNELRYRKGRPEEEIYTSNISSNILHHIYLKNNPFIDENYMTNGSYISSLIDNIQLDYHFDYINNKILNLDYDYYIEAKITSEYVDNDQNLKNPIWNKAYKLTDQIKNDTNNGKILIDESTTINFENYFNMVKEFSNSLSIGTKSKLEVSLVVKVNNISKEYRTIMQIPLNVKAFDINIYKDYQENEVVYSTNKVEKISFVISIVYIILIILISFVSYYFIKKIINKEKNKCLLKIKKILKEYDDRIITVNNFVNYKKLDVVNVASFEELINLSDETFEPIIYWEKSSNRNFEGWFAIIKNRIVYLYILTCPKKENDNI